jgi:gamma-glutamylcyclotransferase
MGRKSNAAKPARPRSTPMSSHLYFAYGSNLHAARLLARAPSARVLGAARALGFALRLDKRGADGTAKANLHALAGGIVWGAVYELDPADWVSLDACERDYARFEIEVERGARRVSAQTYRSDHLIADACSAAAWYKQLILDGAREHALPAEWCAELERLPAR